MFSICVLTKVVNTYRYTSTNTIASLIPRHRICYALLVRRIELGDFFLIAEIHTRIDAHQLARMPRVFQLASSALAAPFAGFGGVELYPALSEKAAIYCARIVSYHPLPDGNKRTGYDVMREFIERNDATFCHSRGDLMATASMIEDLAAGRVAETDFIAWVAHRIVCVNRYRVNVVASYRLDAELFRTFADMLQDSDVAPGIPHIETIADGWIIEAEVQIPPRRQTLTVTYTAGGRDEDEAMRSALATFAQESERAALPEPETLVATIV